MGLAKFTRRQIIVASTAALGTTCGTTPNVAPPAIQFTRIPQADANGSDRHDIIEGTVTGNREGQQIVLYARNRSWWLQPLIEAPFTRILPDAKWRNATHLGSEYAALLVDPGFRPDRSLKMLPRVGGPVAAVHAAMGGAVSPSPTLQFSGYEWRIRNAASNRGGRSNPYSPDNAFIDTNGALHLRVSKKEERFTCAEVALTRSLGYGTYSFLVRDVSSLAPDMTLEMFTWDYAGADPNNREMDIVIRQRSPETVQSARFIVQPYRVSSNVHEFNLPPRDFLHSFRWGPGEIEFVTANPANRKDVIARHTFTLGVPAPGLESARIALYLPHSASPHPAEGEAVIERFEYTP